MSTFINYGMQSEKATLQLPDSMKTACLRCSCYASIGVLKTLRRNSGGKQWEKFTGMITEIAYFLKNNAIADNTDGDGMQLIWTAYETFTEQLEIIVKSGKITNNAFNILHPFATASDSFNTELFATFCKEKHEIPYISERVLIKKSDSAKITFIELSPYQIASRKLRKYVNSHIAPDTRRQKAIYLDGMTTDELDGMTYTEQLYYRIDTARNDAPTAKTLETDRTIQDYIAEMQLTATQTAVLNLRLQGYGYKAIATYQGKTQRAIAKTCGQIAEKARKCGLFNITENDIDEMNILTELCSMCGDENNVFTNKTPHIVTDIPTEKAGDRYAKNTYLREKRAENLRIMFGVKNRIAKSINAENARICANFDNYCSVERDIMDIERENLIDIVTTAKN